ncbi:putative transcriptional regulator, ArsR family protein [Microtetraspora sp. NBRC 16547]|nr:putative transcriptional regulator, ArsR family protein [Microtetraspora sp. NBRC 16547]
MINSETGAAPRTELAAAGALFRSLGDPTRLAIVRLLAGGERRVVDLTTELGLAQSTASSHLACLRDCGLVVGRPEGRQMFYALAQPELLDLLRAAETLLSATGEAVALCPNYGTAASGATTEGGVCGE